MNAEQTDTDLEGFVVADRDNSNENLEVNDWEDEECEEEE